MSDGATNPQRSRGRPRESLGRYNLGQHLDEVRDLFPALATAQSLAALTAAMAHSLGRQVALDPTMISAQLAGSRDLMPRTLRALHQALDLNTYLPEWQQTDQDKGATGWRIWLESITVFRRELRGRVQGEAITLSRMMATADLLAGVGRFLEIDTPQVLGIGRDDQGAPPPQLTKGSQVWLRVRMPFAGHLIVINHDPAQPTQEQYLWLDPLLGCVGCTLPMGETLLPRATKGLPVGGPVGRNALIAFAIREPLALPWALVPPGTAAQSVDPLHLRKIIWEARALPAETRRVCVLDYEVVPPWVSLETHRA
jgi:hypothetical protein